MSLGPAPWPEKEQEDLDWLYIFGTIAHHFPALDLDELPVDVLLALLDELPRIINPKEETPRERVERRAKKSKGGVDLKSPWKILDERKSWKS